MQMIWKQKQLKSKKSKKSANSVEIKDDPKIEETAESVEIDTEISANIAETVISESSAETVNKKEESAQEPSVSNPDEFRRISQLNTILRQILFQLNQQIQKL